MIARRFAVLALVATGAVAFAGCPEVLGHIYVGELYNPDANCLEPGTVVDPALAGPPDDGGICDAICIANEGGRVYISGQCPPYPTTFDLTGKDPQCELAFHALAECRYCQVEGGGVVVMGDACVEASAFDVAREGESDGGRDATSEASKEASAAKDSETDAESESH
jgi:hypothetical protein